MRQARDCSKLPHRPRPGRLPIRLLLFGPPKLTLGEESALLSCERGTQLLVYLALRREWVGRAEFAALLWPEQSSRHAYANLRKALFRMQSQPWSKAVQLQAGALRVTIDTDVADFELALREQRAAAALALRRGEPLAGFDDGTSQAWTDWVGFERDRLRGAWRSAALEHLSGDVEPDAGIELSAQLLEDDPLDESALRVHMTWLVRQGQTARARRAYQDFAARLQRDLAIAPGAPIKALHDSLAAAAPVLVAGLNATQADERDFVGRSIELAKVAELLAQDACRLLCVIGPGGVGKTRLAQQALHRLAPGFADGAVFVPLDDIAQPGELGGRIAREIGLGLAGGADPLDQVTALLRERHMLLVLDNFEQLAADAALLEKLLRTAPRVKMLVTSRVRLGLPAEWLLPLEGLPVPDREDADRIQAFDAVRLFLAAARRVRPALNPAAEAAAIIDICRQVEGLPLALELSAAWTRVLTCAAIAAELHKGSELLRTADPAHPARHASFETVFDQSWLLLTASERDVLARLAVFRGGFSAEAARAVAGAALPVLGALADKSLVRKEGVRLVLHPLVQQLAAARLAERADRLTTEAAHAQYFLRKLAQLRHAVGNADRAALALVETDFENCRSAWRWGAAGHGDRPRGSVMTLLYFCDHRGRFEEGLGLMRAAPGARDDAATAALRQAAAAHFAYRLDRYDEARAGAERALAAARLGHDDDARLLCLKVLGGAALAQERFGDARRHYRQAVKLSQAGADLRGAAAMLDNLALVESALGNFADALAMSRQSLAQHRQLGDVAGEALCLNNLGLLQIGRGDYDDADASLRAGLALCESHGLVGTRGLVSANLADLALKRGDPGAAAQHARVALDLGVATGFRTLVALAHTFHARLAALRGDLAEARAELRTAAELCLALGRPFMLASAAATFAEVLGAHGELACAGLVGRFVADHPAVSALDAANVRAAIAQWNVGRGAPPAWPGLELTDLVQRIVVETDAGYAPLIAQLRATR